MFDAVAVVFWVAVVLLLYTYAGFPVLLTLFAAARRRAPVQKADVTPRVTLIVAAYNEEDNVARRLENALSSDYPAQQLEVVLASDGSTDATESIAACYDASGVRLLRLPRRGKIYALEDAARCATGDLLVFSDANTLMEKRALRALASNFADPSVGGVVASTGYKIDLNAEASGRGESLYWRYDQWIKQLESRTGSVVSAHGGLYAIRNQLFQMPTDRAVTDDFAISTGVVEQGYRLVYEPEARAWEATAESAQGEFGRRVRLTTRGLRGVWMRRKLWNPVRYGFYSISLLTHKVLRRILPLALLGFLAASVALSTTGWLYQAALVGQLAFYALAVAGYVARRSALGGSKWLYVPFYFCLANAAALLALCKFATGRRIERWEPKRSGASAAHPEHANAAAARSVRVAASTGSVGTSAMGTTGAAGPVGSSAKNAAATSVSFTRFARSDVPYAVVVGMDSPTGLQSARILAGHGVPVIGVASNPKHPCCRTRSCERVVKADTTSGELIEVLARLGAALDTPAVLVPCSDLAVLQCSRHRAELETVFRLVLPEPEVVELLVDKARFYEFAARSGFRVPLTAVLRTRGDVVRAAHTLPFPCILKPAVKTPAWNDEVGAKGFRAGSTEELISLYDKLRGCTGVLIAQEWIAGADTDHYTCNAYFGAGSDPLVTFTTRKLRQWPPTAGEACLSEEFRNDLVRDETIRLFQTVRHRGLGYLEMKQRAGSGDYLILEPNVGRPTGRSAQAEASGVELLYTQHCDALGLPLPANREQSFRNVKWIHLRRDLQAGLHHWRRGELTLGDWARSWRGPKQDALFSTSDPIPFFADLGRVAAKLARRSEVVR